MCVEVIVCNVSVVFLDTAYINFNSIWEFESYMIVMLVLVCSNWWYYYIIIMLEYHATLLFLI